MGIVFVISAICSGSCVVCTCNPVKRGISSFCAIALGYDSAQLFKLSARHTVEDYRSSIFAMKYCLTAGISHHDMGQITCW